MRFVSRKDAGYRLGRHLCEQGVEADLVLGLLSYLADFHQVLESRVLDALPCRDRLSLAEGHRHDVRLVFGGGMHRHLPPPTPDVQKARVATLVKAELSTDEIVLGALRRLEGGGRLFEARARVGHRLTEHEAIKVIADVVVMRDRRGITFP